MAEIEKSGKFKHPCAGCGGAEGAMFFKDDPKTLYCPACKKKLWKKRSQKKKEAIVVGTGKDIEIKMEDHPEEEKEAPNPFEFEYSESDADWETPDYTPNSTKKYIKTITIPLICSDDLIGQFCFDDPVTEVHAIAKITEWYNEPLSKAEFVKFKKKDSCIDRSLVFREGMRRIDMAGGELTLEGIIRSGGIGLCLYDLQRGGNYAFLIKEFIYSWFPQGNPDRIPYIEICG